MVCMCELAVFLLRMVHSLWDMKRLSVLWMIEFSAYNIDYVTDFVGNRFISTFSVSLHV